MHVPHSVRHCCLASLNIAHNCRIIVPNTITKLLAFYFPFLESHWHALPFLLLCQRKMAFSGEPSEVKSGSVPIASSYGSQLPKNLLLIVVPATTGAGVLPVPHEFFDARDDADRQALLYRSQPCRRSPRQERSSQKQRSQGPTLQERPLGCTVSGGASAICKREYQGWSTRALDFWKCRPSRLPFGSSGQRKQCFCALDERVFVERIELIRVLSSLRLRVCVCCSVPSSNVSTTILLDQIVV